MSAQHWLGGYNVPPFLEALSAPQPAPAVQWSPSSASVVPPAAATPLSAAAAAVAATPPAALSATPSASASAAPPTAPPAVSSQQAEATEAETEASTSTPSPTTAVVLGTPPGPQQDGEATPEIVSKEGSALERAVSAPAGQSVSREGEEVRGEGKEKEGDADAPLERSASAGQNWRGSGPKIKASRPIQSFVLFVLFCVDQWCLRLVHLRQNG